MENIVMITLLTLTLFGNIEMTTFENRICTQYKKLPLCNPDFIYLDGPDQFKVKKDIWNIHFQKPK